MKPVNTVCYQEVVAGSTNYKIDVNAPNNIFKFCDDMRNNPHIYIELDSWISGYTVENLKINFEEG